MERKFKHRKTGDIAYYKDGVFKQGKFSVEIGTEPSEDIWEEVIEYPIGTKVLDTFSNEHRYTYIKQENGKWALGIQDYFDIDEKCIGENKRFQLVLDKTYDILTFKYLLGESKENSFYCLIDGKYRNSSGSSYNDINSLLYSNRFAIYSVKRNSDEEVFTIGDKTNEGIIKSFESAYEDIFVRMTNNNTYSLDCLTRTTPLFTTEDGVSIFEGDRFYRVFLKHLILDSSCYFGVAGYNYNNFLMAYFSTIEAAEEFILLNKPCLSVNDIMSFSFTEPLDEEELKLELRKVAKSRL